MSRADHTAARSDKRKDREAEVYVVETTKGFTESFDQRQIETLVTLGLIWHVRDGHVLEDGHGNGVGPIHHFYNGAA